MASQRARAATESLAFLGIAAVALVLLNVIVWALPPVRLDLTKDEIFTLSTGSKRLAGRLSDRFPPVRVAVAAQLIGAAGAASLILAGGPTSFLAGMLVFGLGLSAAAPAKQVLALQWSSSDDRRKVFAYKFTGEALGMAAGAFIAGHLVNLDRPDGLNVGFLMAAAGFVVSSAIIAIAGRGAVVPSEFTADPTGAIAAIEGRSRGILRLIFANPALRWTAVVTVTLALGFYAQFESGLPAYGITVLGFSRDATVPGKAPRRLQPATPSYVVQQGDVLMLVGTEQEMAHFLAEY